MKGGGYAGQYTHKGWNGITAKQSSTNEQGFSPFVDNLPLHCDNRKLRKIFGENYSIADAFFLNKCRPYKKMKFRFIRYAIKVLAKNAQKSVMG